MGHGSDDRYDNRWRDRGDDRWSERGHMDRDRDFRRGGYGRGGGDDRGFFERAGDEVRAWFGDDEAQRRREIDERRWEQERRMSGRRDDDYDRGASGWMGGGWGNQRGESWNRERPGERGWFGGSDRDEREGWFSSSIGGERGRRWGGSGGGDRFERSYGGRSPVGETFGAGATAGHFGSSSYGSGGRTGGDIHDPHYSEWRRRQIDELDRDYDEYRREHQSKFEEEFGGWREKRRGQRQLLGRVSEHMEVVGSDGSHVGKVDKVRGDRIILAKSDPKAGGMHHSVPCGWIERVDDKVVLNRTADSAMDAWRNEDTGRALFEREDSGSEGPHALDRSFSGTYGGRSDD
ncbi:MAG TPA: DUF2171 domain-containing protein [Allosphingosinicella sp.]|nr:DUF2171 domain-containing protein [Allosphingosinicella sp.]